MRCTLTRVTILVACLAGFCVAGCSGPRLSWPFFGNGNDKGQLLTEEDLAAEMNDFADSFSGKVQDAADRIAEKSDDRLIRKRALRWKVTSTADCRRAVLEDMSRIAYADLLALCIQLRFFFQEGKPVFGADQEIATKTMLGLEKQIRGFGNRIFPKDRLDEIISDVERFANEHPASGLFIRDPYRLENVKPDQKNALVAVLSVPLKPFRVFDGIDQGARAISEVAQVMDRTASIVQELPQRIRWQMQILSYELEEMQVVEKSMEDLKLVATAVDRVATTSERLASVAESLPDELRKSVDQAFEQVDERQQRLEKLLSSARETVSAVQGVADSAERMTTASEQVAANLTEAGNAWEGTFVALRDITGKADDESASPPAEKEDEGTGFDITQYGDAAAEIARAGQELTATLEELNRLLGSGELQTVGQEFDRTAQTTLQMTGEEGRDLADHITWRIVQLVLFLFALVLVYRFVSVRFGRSA